MEQKEIEKELSSLMEVTLRLEDELNHAINGDSFLNNVSVKDQFSAELRAYIVEGMFNREKITFELIKAVRDHIVGKHILPDITYDLCIKGKLIP